MIASAVVISPGGLGVPLRAGAAVASGPAAIADGVLAPDTVDGQFALEGEYGLAVREMNRVVEVRWITRSGAVGFLEAWSGDRLVYSATTAQAQAHVATFPRPRGSTLLLRYGAADDAQDRHETMIYPSPPARRAAVTFANVDSVFVVGDIHGEFDTLIRLLRNAHVIDDQLRWSAGRSHLVLLGDLFDRGADVTRLLWWVYGLERQAERAGGRVHTVLGNHEIMVMTEDLRYVAPKEMLIAHLHETSYGRMFDPRHSVLGQWLAAKPAILRIDDVLYAHGGVTEDHLSYSLRTYDDSLAAFMREDLFYHWADTTAALPVTLEQVRRREAFFWGDNSAFWFRGYVQSDTLEQSLRRVLRHFRSNLHVVAHTPVSTIADRYRGSVIAVNVAQPASELLLLVRQRRGEARRYRWGVTGPPEPLPVRTTMLAPPPPTVGHGHRPGTHAQAPSAAPGPERSAPSSP
jgi:hypothetical protein